MIDVGSTIGNYVVRAKIGEGGMGMVWMAEHPLIGKKVAIKVIHPNYARNPEAVSRFFTEAQAVNKIGHPNIVDITDFTHAEGSESFFVMEFLAGESLATRHKNKGLTLAETVHVCVQVADALAASHAAGILHRDLKPDNVFLVKRGQDPLFAKVLDFGLAKLTKEADKASGTHKTRTGSMMGTPYYMSPEQCAGKADIGAPADVYALGVMIFELVSGTVPFEGEGYGEIIVQHMTQPAPSLRSRVPDCPPWLDDLVARCLLKDPKQRPSSMSEVRDILQEHLHELPGGTLMGRPSSSPGLGSRPPWSQSQPPSPGEPARPISTLTAAAGEAPAAPAPAASKKGLFIAGAAVLAVAGAIGLYLATRKPPEPPQAAAQQPPVTRPAPEPVAQPSPEPSPAPPTATTVDLKLDTNPSGAKVTLADGTVVCATTPCTWTAQRGTAAVKLTYELAGYETRTRDVVPAETRGISTDLVAAPVKKTSGSRHHGSGKTRPSGGDDGFKPID